MVVTTPKVTKSSVNYGKGMEERRCGNCTYFRKPSACVRVTGRIEPDMWCRLFKEKK